MSGFMRGHTDRGSRGGTINRIGKPDNIGAGIEMIGQILKKDYYILPSSVHEVIIVPYSEIYVCSKLDEMVREINSTQVEEEDVLSNHVYLYDRVSGKLRVGSSVQTGRMMA